MASVSARGYCGYRATVVHHHLRCEKKETHRKVRKTTGEAAFKCSQLN